jgi:hypothetical protein
MLEALGDFFGLKAPQTCDLSIPEPFLNGAAMRKNFSGREQVFSKIFRWRLPEGHTREPVSVEVVGSFTHWEKVPLTYDSTLDTWQVTLDRIRINHTHRYMILVDGKPAYDKHNDGLALPQGPEEEQHQIMTDKGPRVFMLFSQTK